MCYSYPLEMSQYYHYTYSEPMSLHMERMLLAYYLYTPLTLPYKLNDRFLNPN